MKLARLLRRHRIAAVILGLHLVALVAGIAAGAWLARDLPDLASLDPAHLPQSTLLFDRAGQPLKTFAEQQRTTVSLSKVSPLYLKALLATEDPRFYSHIGVDLQAVARAVFATFRSLRWGVQGGSTLTQQLARLYFLHPQKTLTRKLQEAYLALQIEKSYSKEEILTLYVNSVYLGHGQYGVESAAEYYFDRSAADLTLGQAAMLAGLTQRPEDLSPIRRPDRARQRRSHVLDRLVDEGWLERAAATTAKNEPLVPEGVRATREFAPYFVEEIRRQALARFGEESLYRGGLRIRTTLDPRLQVAAEAAVADGLAEYGKRHKQIPQPVPVPIEQRSSLRDRSWSSAWNVGDTVQALVLGATRSEARLRVGSQELAANQNQVEWTGRIDLSRLFPAGTLVPIRILRLGAGSQIVDFELAPAPSANAALIAADPRTGEILAMVGGKSFDQSEFNRATQAKRQAGSAFKPFIVAAGLEQGISPGQLLFDAPTVFIEPGQPEPYQPENYDRKYEGMITLRRTLEDSRNIPTIRLLDAIGFSPAVEMARRLGIATDLQPFPSLALGAFEVRLIDLIAAYGCFANGGVLVHPRLVNEIKDINGQITFRADAEAREAISPELAARMTSLLQGVIQRGTGRPALSLGVPVAGKTGTTDDYTDAWFVGYTPSLVAAVWIGHDQRRPLGKGESGAVAALPIWIDFMRDALQGRSAEPFVIPPGLEVRTVDAVTGKLASSVAGCSETIEELYPEGAAPTSVCSVRDHTRAALPYPLQSFPIERDGSLRLPPEEAVRLTTLGPDKFRIVGQGDAISYQFGEQRGSIALAWDGADWERYLHSLAPPPPAEDQKRGADDWFPVTLSLNRSGTIRLPEVPQDR